MPLTLYRRHLKSCRVYSLKLAPKVMRAFTACECPIWLCGRTEKSIVPRQSTGTSDWATAEALRRSLDAQEKDAKIHGPLLSECIDDFTASKESELGVSAKRHYRISLAKFSAYCAERGVFHCRQITVDLVEKFKVQGFEGMKGTSKASYFSKLRSFLRDAYRRGWIQEPLGDRVSAFSASSEQTDPFTDEEVERLLKGTETIKKGKYSRKRGTFKLLLELMLETGLRVSDAVVFNPKELVRGEHMWIYKFSPQKRKKIAKARMVEAFISDRLKTAIDNCEWMSPAYPFLSGATQNKDYLNVYYRMQEIGTRCDIEDCRPHRLRDTFAVRALLRGIGLDDVSRLLGHSSVLITQTYYAKWVSARKSRLERLLSESLMNP